MHRQKLCDWVDGTGGRVSVFDFTTKGILQAAVKGELWRLEDTNGKSPGLIGNNSTQIKKLYKLLQEMKYLSQIYMVICSKFGLLGRLDSIGGFVDTLPTHIHFMRDMP